MKRLVVGMSFIAILVLGLAACSKEDDTSTQSEEDDDAEASQPEKEEASYEPISATDFSEEFLAGNFKKVYAQISPEFQNQVSFEELEQLGLDFNQDVDSFELVSEMPLLGVTEYQWVSNNGDKGIRSYWTEDLTIEGLQLMPISTFPESDTIYTENTYQMPVNEEWFILWGGTNELVNYHYAVESQRYAYDLLIMEEGNSFEGEPTENESYFAFDKDVVAPLAGVVFSTENEIVDNTPNVETNADKPLGNHVIIEHENNEYSVIAHLKQGSVEVSKGDEIQAGDLLGLAGNSGNSSEPHIHFHVADSVKWEEASSIRIKLDRESEPVRGDGVSGF